MTLAFIFGINTGPIRHDYSVTVDVDKPEKIAIMVTNLINHVESKQFVLTDITIHKNFSNFSITVKGTEYTNLINQ